MIGKIGTKIHWHIKSSVNWLHSTFSNQFKPPIRTLLILLPKLLWSFSMSGILTAFLSMWEQLDAFLFFLSAFIVFSFIPSTQQMFLILLRTSTVRPSWLTYTLQTSLKLRDLNIFCSVIQIICLSFPWPSKYRASQLFLYKSDLYWDRAVETLWKMVTMFWYLSRVEKCGDYLGYSI